MNPAIKCFRSFGIPHLITAIVLFTGALQAQNSTASLRGEVQDASAARVAGARVVIRLSGSLHHPRDNGK